MDHLDQEEDLVEPSDSTKQLAWKMKMLRSKASCETLLRLCLIAVVKNHDYFLQLPSELEETEELVSPSVSCIQRANNESTEVSSYFVRSPINKVSKPANFNKSSRLSLKSLPNTIVQHLMDTIFEQARWKKPKLIYSYEKEDAFMLLLLSNPNVTEYICGMFFDYGDHSETDKIFNHLLKNCPKMNYYIGHHDCEDEYLKFPALMLSKWGNLKHLEMVRFYMTDESVKVIQEALPFLEKLSFCMTTMNESDTVQHITLASVEYMAKMHNLKILNIEESCFKLSIEERTNIIGNCAGRIPNLKEFYIETFCHKLLGEVVNFHGKHYSNKKLTLNAVQLKSSFLGIWPSSLRVENLCINGLTSDSVEKLCGSKLLPVKEFISFVRMRPFQIHSLLKRLGAELTVLVIYSVRAAENFDLKHVMACCPQLQILRIHNSETMNLVETKSESSPCIFKKLKCLSIDNSLASITSEREFLKLYKMFLIGSENKDEEMIVHGHTIATVLEALEEQPACLSKVGKIEFELYDFGLYPNHNFVHFAETIVVCKLLALCSVDLKKLKLSGTSSNHQYLQEKFDELKIFVENAGVQFEGPRVK